MTVYRDEDPSQLPGSQYYYTGMGSSFSVDFHITTSEEFGLVVCTKEEFEQVNNYLKMLRGA